MNSKINNRDISLDWMRGILTLLVIIGHCTFLSINTQYGGMYYYEELIETGREIPLAYKIISEMKDVIYKFHMPAFFVLSGILFGRQRDAGLYKSFTRLIISKCKRLIIPFLVCWLLWNIPLKYLSNYYEPVNNNIGKMLLQIFNPYQVHLWYLPSLFFVFIIFYLLLIISIDKKFRIGICCILYIVGVLVRYKYGAPLGNPFLYAIWFEVGLDNLGFAREREHAILTDILLFTVLYIISKHIRYSWIVFDLLLGYLGTDFVYRVSRRLTDNCDFHLSAISKHSFGIYLLSDPINYLVLFKFVKLFGVQSLASNYMVILLFLIRFILTLFVPLIMIISINRIAGKQKNI